MANLEEKLIIDRIIEGIAVCETSRREMIEIPLENLPQNVKEGDCLQRQNGVYLVDKAETETRRAKNRELLRQLLERGDGA